MTDAPDYKRLPRRRSRRWQPLRRAAEVALVRALLGMAGRARVPTLQRVGRGLGTLLYVLSRRHRATCHYQLGLVLPELTPEARRDTVRACFRNFGMTACEAMALPRLRAEGDRWVRSENEAVLAEAHARGKGVLLVTAHYGNWELLPVVLRRLGQRAVAVVRPMANPRVNELMLDLRRCPELDVAQRGTEAAPRQMLACLRRGEGLIMAIDQDIKAQGVFVDFFGIPANTPRAPASLALKTGAAVVAYFDTRRPDGTHVLRFEAVPVTDAIRNADDPARALTQAIADATEAQIRRDPTQWAWHHPRWRRRPPPGGNATGTATGGDNA